MKKILLVNASRYFFDEGKSLLDRKDFHVFMASSAKQGLMIHRQEKVSLIVSELDMPETGGDVLCSLIRGETEIRTVSMILVCHDLPAEIERAARCGANSWIAKPFRAQTLLDQVEKLLAISTRRGYRVLLRAKVKGLKEDNTFFCTSENISVTGILIETDRMLAIGDIISCSFYLPGAAHIVAEGEVVRSERTSDQKNRCGVRFLPLSAESSKEIEKFIAATVFIEPQSFVKPAHLASF